MHVLLFPYADACMHALKYERLDVGTMWACGHVCIWSSGADGGQGGGGCADGDVGRGAGWGRPSARSARGRVQDLVESF